MQQGKRNYTPDILDQFFFQIPFPNSHFIKIRFPVAVLHWQNPIRPSASSPISNCRKLANPSSHFTSSEPH